MLRWSPLLLLFSETLLAVESTGKGLGVKTSPLGSESLFQTAGGLLLILVLIIGGAWLFKRYANLPMAGKGYVKVLGGASVGARERVVVVEVENKRLLLGVAPGQVRNLYELPSDSTSFQQELDKAHGRQDEQSVTRSRSS
ncbi:MAG: flagellar biosynthetic protein FliO [Candidatus Thiodiazotropha sp. (ex Monitilora ramsayi)]|nr:flagellar biosynthetic protein FliO [Candidatus Thiodiazotropha sp. (ex Monitilora ramsayi)]